MNALQTINMRTNFFKTFQLPAVVAGIAVFMLVGGCSQTAGILPNNGDPAQKNPTTPASAFSQFPDIPVPAGSEIIVDKTLVFGSKPWFGQLTLSSSGSANAAFDFFRGNLTGFGWEEVTSVRAPTSILTYAREDRVLAIAIRGGTLTGSELTITVSPRGKPQPQGGAQGILPPPVQRTTQ